MSAAMAPSKGYITLSVISLWFLSAQAYYKLIPAENILSGFSKTGIQPLNHPVFHDDEFLPSTLPTGINSLVANQVSTASPSVLSLPSVSNKPLERTETCTTHDTYVNPRKGSGRCINLRGQLYTKKKVGGSLGRSWAAS